MKRRVRNDHRVDFYIDARDHVVEQRAETNVRDVIGRACCALHGERIDEMYLVTGSAKDRCRLHWSHVYDLRMCR